MMPAGSDSAISAPAASCGLLAGQTRGPRRHALASRLLWTTIALMHVLAPPCAAQTSQAEALQATKPPAAAGWTAEVKHRPLPSAKPRATAIRISGDATRTRIRMEVDRPIAADMLTLDEPYRAIIDVPDLEFQLPAYGANVMTGLVKDFRYGRFDAGRSRVVIDLAAPATIQNSAFTPPKGNQPGVLSFDIVRITASDFQALRGQPLRGTAEPAAAPPPQQFRVGRHEAGPAGQPSNSLAQSGAPPISSAPRPKTRPVVLIDPGHGGIDPGTVGAGGITEKSVTLAVAKEVRALLQQGRRLDVYLTRDADNFVTLDQRVHLSRQYQADLFVSIHADNLAEKELANSIKGATVYTLSDRASDEKARRVAEKENAADIAAGLAAVPASAEEQVRNILLDLVERETANYSLGFRNLLLSSMRGRVPLAKDPQRSAAFKVLKQDEVPAVLIELGYMSNAEDLARLGKADGQRQLATSIAAAITTFFAHKEAQAKR